MEKYQFSIRNYLMYFKEENKKNEKVSATKSNWV